MSNALEPTHFSWFRFYHDLPSAIPVRKLSDFEYRVLTVCYCFANRSPVEDRLEGALTVAPTGEPVGSEYIAEEASSDARSTDKALGVLLAKKLLRRRESDGALLVSFMWHQYASDSSTARTKKHRDGKKGVAHLNPLASLPEQTKQTEQTKRNVSPNVPEALHADSAGATLNPLTGEYDW